MTPPPGMDQHIRGRTESRARIAQRAALRQAVEGATQMLAASEIRELVDRTIAEIEADR